MAISYTYYKREDGEIIGSTTGWLDESLAQLYAYIEGYGNGRDTYVRDGEFRQKRDWSPEINGKTATGLPSRCTVYCGGSAYQVTDGSITLDTPEELKMDVTVRSAEWLEKGFKL
jgi:uncharacterized protein involved in tellurium resistance